MSIYEEIYYKRLAHMIMAAVKSQDLHLSSWRPREADSVIQVCVKGLSSRRYDGVSSRMCQSLKAGENRCPS